MKRNNNELGIPDFRQKFLHQKYVTKTALKKFYAGIYNDLTDQKFRRILYGLEQECYIISSGSGVYTVQNPDHLLSHVPRKHFKPIISQKIMVIKENIQEAFPYIDCVIWETHILHDFMIHQPNINMIILEVEKSAQESVFNHLLESNFGPVYLSPDRTLVERYVFQQSESIIVSRLITRSPRGQKGKAVPYAKIEKILIDLLVDRDKYFIYQGRELAEIYENVFREFVINEDSLINYAKRRTAIEKLKVFIQNQTKIELRSFQEGSE